MTRRLEVPEEMKAEMRHLFLQVGWGYKRIGKHLALPSQTVRGYLRYHGLDKKKKDGTWTQEDVVTPGEAALQKIEEAHTLEKKKIAAAQAVGRREAGKVVEMAVTREVRAKEQLDRMVEVGVRITERLGSVIEKLETDSQAGIVVNVERDSGVIKELTHSYTGLVRALRELAGESDITRKVVADKERPIRIGIIGSVRIDGGEIMGGAGSQEKFLTTVET